VRTKLAEAFEDARADDVETQLVVNPGSRRLASAIQ
jgi:hypothetical protein